MATLLKDFFSPQVVRRLAAQLAHVHPPFDETKFIRIACDGLDDLELMARGRQIAIALRACLPAAYPDALDALLRSVHASPPPGDIGGPMAPFFYLPHVLFVADYGLDHFALSMQAQHALTQRFTAEFSIRHFIAADPERAFGYLHAWAGDAEAQVRRLVSEGTRLRLPWAMRVRWLDQHPERIVELLEVLKDDPSETVRRSVANNLNDIARAWPAIAGHVCGAWLRGASEQRRALVRHALRGAVRRGEPYALRLLGVGAAAEVQIERVSLRPKRVVIGERVAVSFGLRSTATAPQELLVDLAVHFVKQHGKTARKVFRLKRLTLAPGEPAMLSGSVSLAVHTTRKPQPGVHAVEVIVNGRALPLGAFNVVAPRSAPRMVGRKRSKADR